MHKVPWKQVVVFRRMTAYPEAAFSGQFQPLAVPLLGSYTFCLTPSQLHCTPAFWLPACTLAEGNRALQAHLCWQGEASMFLCVCWPFSLFFL